MADANTDLRQMAIQIANDLVGRKLHLHKEITKAELHVAELKLELDESSAAHQRSLDFSPSIGGNFQCPDCYVRRGSGVTLTPQNSPDDRDIFVCKTCGGDFTLEA